MASGPPRRVSQRTNRCSLSPSRPSARPRAVLRSPAGRAGPSGSFLAAYLPACLPTARPFRHSPSTAALPELARSRPPACAGPARHHRHVVLPCPSSSSSSRRRRRQGQGQGRLRCRGSGSGSPSVARAVFRRPFYAPLLLRHLGGRKRPRWAERGGGKQLGSEREAERAGRVLAAPFLSSPRARLPRRKSRGCSSAPRSPRRRVNSSERCQHDDAKAFGLVWPSFHRPAHFLFLLPVAATIEVRGRSGPSLPAARLLGIHFEQEPKPKEEAGKLAFDDGGSVGAFSPSDMYVRKAGS